MLRRYDDPSKIDWGKVTYIAMLISITLICAAVIIYAFVKELAK